MKNLYAFAALCLLLSATACSEKEIQPSNVVFDGGTIAQLIQIVSEPATLSKAGEDSLLITLRLRLERETSCLQNSQADLIEFISEGSPAEIILTDDSGADLGKFTLRRSHDLKFKKIFMADKGNEGEYVFFKTFGSKDLRDQTFERAGKFSAGNAGSLAFVGNFTMEGVIGSNMWVNGSFTFNGIGNDFTGRYGYKGRSSGITVSGRIEKDGRILATEYNGRGAMCGSYEGQKTSPNEVVGSMTNYLYDTYSFNWKFIPTR